MGKEHDQLMRTMHNIIMGHRNSVHERLGQYFVNRFIAGNWPELFFEEDESLCIRMIESWLIDHQYTTNEPPKVREFE